MEDGGHPPNFGLNALHIYSIHKLCVLVPPFSPLISLKFERLKSINMQQKNPPT